ncbi:MAG: macro domain-containing protein [Saprospiraceae bacterium]|nr:macro domain-containing protein [Saprospiraceae bacterium]
MIKEVEGDILMSKADAIAHGIASMDNFGSGLAASLRQDYPSLYKDFRHYCQTFHPKMGEVWLWQSADKKKIFNLLTQEPPIGPNSHPGKATTSAVRHSLKKLVLMLESEGIKSIALPKLSTGVGALEWQEVKPIIYEHMEHLNIPVYIYSKFVKGLAANEE